MSDATATKTAAFDTDLLDKRLEHVAQLLDALDDLLDGERVEDNVRHVLRAADNALGEVRRDYNPSFAPVRRAVRECEAAAAGA